MNRRQKLKAWIIDHQEAVAIVGMVVTVGVMVTVVAKATAKANARYLAEREMVVKALNDLVAEERAAGKIIYPLTKEAT